jgi:hypothetical protein
MSMRIATDPGLVPVAESFRERIARHVSGDSDIASNFDVIAQSIASESAAEPVECKDCQGYGFRALAPERRAVWDIRFREENHLWQLRIDDLREEAKAARQAPEWHCKEISVLRRKQTEHIKALRHQCNRESVCGTCLGTGQIAEGESEPVVKHDSVWTTVPCWRCRGVNVGRDGTRAAGTSTGETWERDDGAAERGDVCPECLGDGYLTPISVRPKASAPDFTGDYVMTIDDLPHRRRCFAEPKIDDQEPDDAEEYLESVREEDPLVAAAIAVLNGPRSDEWATHNWGRRFALWPLCPSGRRLAEESSTREQAGDEYTRTMAIIVATRLRETQVDVGSPRLRTLISLADDEARRLEARADRAIQKAEAA